MVVVKIIMLADWPKVVSPILTPCKLCFLMEHCKSVCKTVLYCGQEVQLLCF